MKNRQIALLFSHTLTLSQEKDVLETLEVRETHKLPKEEQALWSQVPVDKDLSFDAYLKSTKAFLTNTLNTGDFVLIQGDFGATYHMIQFCKSQSFTPIYSVNRRVASEKIEDGKLIKYSEFEHECFREYV